MSSCGGVGSSSVAIGEPRIYRETGGRVRTNVFVDDLDLPLFNKVDERRLEVVIDGLPLFRGAQLAIDTTLVWLLTREGVAKPRCATENGASLTSSWLGRKAGIVLAEDDFLTRQPIS